MAPGGDKEISPKKKKKATEQKKTNEFLKHMTSLFEPQDRDKFSNCFYKLRDSCNDGLPSISYGSKIEKMLYERIDILSSLIRGNRQKQSIAEAVMRYLSELSGPYSAEILIWTVCLALVLQYPRRDIRWSDVELSELTKTVTRLQTTILPALSWEAREDVTPRQVLAVCWCHSVLLYVARSIVLFVVGRGQENVAEVWEIPEMDLRSEASGRAIHYLLKKQRSLHRGLMLGCRKAKAVVFARPTINVLRTFAASRDDKRLTELRAERKRRVLVRSFARHCVFEIDEDPTVPVKRARLNECAEKTSSDLLSLIRDTRSEADVREMEEKRVMGFVQTLQSLQYRFQSLTADEKMEVTERTVIACRCSSSLLSRFPSGQLHVSLLKLWTFLTRRKRLITLIPNAQIFFTFLLFPRFEEMSLDIFVASSTALSSFLLLYLSLSRKRILAAPAVFLQAVRGALEEVMRRGDVVAKPKLPDVSALCTVAQGFSNFLMHLCEAENREEMSRMVRLLLDDYFQRAQTYTVHPDVKRALLQIVYILLDVIDPFLLEQLKLDLKIGPRELLKRVLVDYRSLRNKDRSK